MHFLHHGGAAPGQPVDHGEFPEGPAPVEGLAGQFGGQLSGVGFGGPDGQLDAPEVVIQVEVRVVLPGGRKRAQAGDHPAAEPGHDSAGPPQTPPEAFVVRAAVEQAEVGKGRRKVGVCFEVPHQGLDVVHPFGARRLFVDHLATLCPSWEGPCRSVRW